MAWISETQRCRPVALAAVTVVFAAIAGPVFCGDLDDVRARGTLVMLCSPHQESHFVRTNLAAGAMKRRGTSADFQGIDVDIMGAFAERLGVELEIHPGLDEGGMPSYSVLIPELLAGEGDVIASSFSITPARQEKVAFSDPYVTIQPVVLVRKGSDITSVEDLAGRRASTIHGSSQEEHLQELGFDEERLEHVEFMLENYLAVDEGRVDFTVVDSGSAERVLSQFPDLEVAFALEGAEEGYGFAFRQGSDLVPEMNALLAEMREAGDLAAVFERHGPQDE